MSRVVTLFLLFCAVNALPTFNLNKNEIPDFEEEEESRRLPNSTAPVNYDLSITTNLPEMDYTGTLRIQIIVLEEETSLLVLNQFQIDISLIMLSDSEGELIEIGEFTQDDDLRLLRIPTINPLTVGETYFLNILFNSILRSDNYGFYRTSFIDQDGVTKLVPIYLKTAN